MSKVLLIVESPAKARTIGKYLGSGYEVLASKGHIKDLPKKGGVDVENDFKETYEIIVDKGKDEIVKTIRAAAKKADKVLLAPDPDREGEAIAYHLMEIVKEAQPGAEIKRVLFNEITKKGVSEGLQTPRELDSDLYEAQRTRRVLDRIGGYPLSSLLWSKLAFGLSAGRVQTPALRIIVDRQRERDAFVPQKYWLVEVMLVGSAKENFAAMLQEIDGKKLEKVASRYALTDEKNANDIAAALKNAKYRIAEITRKKQNRKAPPPYITSKIQQDGANKLGFTPKRTMSIAQKLYEGEKLGKGKDAEIVGLITYMRTDSVRVSPDAIAACREYIAKKFGKDAMPEQANFFKSKKENVQDAHEAIRPTRMDLLPEKLENLLKPEELKLYRMIWNRFVASQMAPAQYDQTSVDIEAESAAQKFTLRASGSILRVPGWLAAHGMKEETEAEKSDNGEEDEGGGRLPEVSENEALKLVDPPGVQAQGKVTEPPPYFTEASLVKKLEEEGIGRPSTYAEIISKVEQRDYVSKDGNRLIPTALGKIVIDSLVKEGFDLADISFTRGLEESLDLVEEKKKKRIDVLKPFHERLQAQIKKANAHKGKWWPEPEVLERKCPDCGSELSKRWGRNGQFIGCAKYPECRFTQNIGPDGEAEPPRKMELTDFDCDKCGSKMAKRWGRNGWFLGCSKYPKCKNAKPIPLGYKCPKCKTGDVVPVRARKRAKPFYGCSNYNATEPCDFRAYAKPIGEKCPQCDCEFLIPAGGKKAPKLKCGNPTCDFEKPFDGVIEDGEAQPVEKPANAAIA